MPDQFMRAAIEEAKKGLTENGFGPFGACVVKKGKVIAVARNSVVKENDPTAHAEVKAIRQACKTLDTFDLHDCELYTTCEPCLMCFGAIYWSRLEKVFYGCTRKEAAKHGFDDEYIYHELEKVPDLRQVKTVPKFLFSECLNLFEIWTSSANKTKY